MLINIRGNRRILSIEHALEILLPQKLSRTKLLEKAVSYAFNDPDLDWLDLSEKMRNLPDDNIVVPSFMQAHLSESAAGQFKAIKNRIYQAIKRENENARYVQDKYVWQICLMALLEHLKQEASLSADDDKTDYDKLKSAGLFVELLMSTDEADNYLASKMIADLDAWDKDRSRQTNSSLGTLQQAHDPQ